MNVPETTGRVQEDACKLVTVTQSLRAALRVAVPVQIAMLQEWVILHELEDDEFFKLLKNTRTKKAAWVAYVQKKLDGMP